MTRNLQSLEVKWNESCGNHPVSNCHFEGVDWVMPESRVTGHAKQTGFIMRMFQQILCATDFSETSAKAVAYAEELAIETGAELILLHAFENPATWSLDGQIHPRELKLQQQMDSLLVDSPRADDIHRLLHAGEAGQVICWVAQDRHCDLIVMGTHGRTGLRHLLFGSTAEYVLRHARCPVLTIRDRSSDEPLLTQPLVMPVPAPRFM